MHPLDDPRSWWSARIGSHKCSSQDISGGRRYSPAPTRDHLPGPDRHIAAICADNFSAAPNQSIPNKKPATLSPLNSEFCHTHTHTRRIYQYKTGSLRLGEYKTLDNYCLFTYLLAHLVMDRQLLSTQQEEAVILVHNPCYNTIPYSLIRRI
jgi:hypothetical protein